MIHNLFQSFKIFSEQEITDVLECFVIRRLGKDDIFVHEGEKCSEIAFIQSGIFRSYLYSENGKETTFCFRFPNDLLASYSSFITGKPSVETIQAISNAELMILKKAKIEELSENNQSWTRFLKLIAEQEYIELEKRFFQFQRENASQRYKMLIKNHPDYVQNIPLQYLASYLGITQRHLSRIRKEIFF